MDKRYEHIKQAAYIDELQKIATKNPVAAYSIKGSTLGAGIGSGGAAVIVYKLLKKVDPKIPRTPLVAAAAIAGAILGARTGGSMGAYMGGGVKGTAHMMDYHP